MTDQSIRPFKTTILFIALSVLFGLGLVFFSDSPPKPLEQPLQPSEAILEGGLPIIQGNTLLPIIGHPETQVLGVIIHLESKRVLSGDEMSVIVNEKYPGMAGLLLCIIHKESGFYQLALGDKDKNGIYHAFGAFQIHRWKHNLTEDQVFDFEFSLDWAVKKIRNGYGYIWTTYKLCI